MAQGYRCRKCGWQVTVGVPTVALTRIVSELLTVEVGRMIVYHDWSPSSTDTAMRKRAEEIWDEKCEAYFTASKNLRNVPESCVSCGSINNWDITLRAPE